MQQSESIQTTNYQRIRKLLSERALEVKRDGIRLTLNTTQNQDSLCFSFDEDDYPRVNALLQQEKYGLQVCQQNGHAVISLSFSQILDVSIQTLVVWSQNNTVNLSHFKPYYLMKQNASNSIHKSMLYNPSVNEISLYIQQKVNLIPPPSIILRFPYQQDLNQRQNQALKKVGQNRLTFIKGPPGCGKTRTIARLCKLLYLEGKKIVVGTVSNTGNLSILKQVIKQLLPYQSQEWIERFMYNMYTHPHTCFMLEEQRKYIPLKIVLLTPLQTAIENAQLQPLTRYFSVNICVIRKMFEINKDQDLDLISLYSYFELIATNYRTYDKILNKVFSLYKQAVKKIISEADIIITTTVLSASIHNKTKEQPPFRPDVAILDQASQATWGDTYCYLQFPIQRLVLVGDDKQLDPTVLSQDKLLKETVFTKMYYRTPQYSVMLNIQYRMHPRISIFPNYFFYENQLMDGVTEHQRSNNIGYFSHHPLSFINHYAPEQYTEQPQNGKKNYYNEQEITIIAHFLAFFPVQELKNVGIISPYTLQVKKLSERFTYFIQQGLTIKSCDGYQGGQKDFIIFSCVRSNEERKIGFCGQKNRINVSLTRARKALLIVGNSVTLSMCSQIQHTQNIWHYLIQFLHNSKVIFQEQDVLGYLAQLKKNKEEVMHHQYSKFQGQNNINYQYEYQPQVQIQENNGYVGQLKATKPIELEKQQLIKQKQEDRIQRLIEKLSKLNKQENQEQLDKKNKELMKQIRKNLQNLSNKAEKQSPQQFKQYLGQKLYQFYGSYDKILERVTSSILQQVLSLLRTFRSEAMKHSEEEFQKCLKQVLEFKQQNNHLKLMQLCLQILRKCLIYYLIELYL